MRPKYVHSLSSPRMSSCDYGQWLILSCFLICGHSYKNVSRRAQWFLDFMVEGWLLILLQRSHFSQMLRTSFATDEIDEVVCTTRRKTCCQISRRCLPSFLDKCSCYNVNITTLLKCFTPKKRWNSYTLILVFVSDLNTYN